MMISLLLMANIVRALRSAGHLKNVNLELQSNRKYNFEVND